MTATNKIETTIVHPTVLLAIVDHLRHNSTDRVIGVILGHKINDEIHITNSYALPFEEDTEIDSNKKERNTWFFDTTYQKTMFGLVKKINSYEEVLGWYHTGIESSYDIEIMNCFRRLVTLKNTPMYENSGSKKEFSPLMLVVNVKARNKANSYPIRVYGIDDEDNFYNIDSRIEAEEAEEVGVEHLLREIRDETKGYMKDQVNTIKDSLASYQRNLQNIIQYLEEILCENKKCSHEILFEIQDALNCIPKIDHVKCGEMNDVYVSCLTKNVIKLKDLIRNRAENETLI